jgi:hypothetical protein
MLSRIAVDRERFVQQQTPDAEVIVLIWGQFGAMAADRYVSYALSASRSWRRRPGK